jgi:hypothetical protein
MRTELNPSVGKNENCGDIELLKITEHRVQRPPAVMNFRWEGPITVFEKLCQGLLLE